MNLWIKFLIWYGHLCKCGGEKEDMFEEWGWHKERCVKCGKITKN